MKEIKDMTLSEVKNEINKMEIAITYSWKRNNKKRTPQQEEEYERLTALRQQRTFLQQKAEEEIKQRKNKQNFIRGINDVLRRTIG